MKQIIQSLSDGSTILAEVPSPNVLQGGVLVGTDVSLVSVGTERMLVEFGKGNLLQKARQQPDKVRQVFEKMRTDGILATLDAVKNKLDTPLPLGYCNVGRVLELGKGVTGFELGERVVSNGKHAEVVSVPMNLCARVPDVVSDEAASFTVLGAIALQGIRLLKPTLGETIAVSGLGLIGLLAVQLLRANGCRVIGFDFDASKVALAKQFGADAVVLGEGVDAVEVATAFARGRGVDGVLITASTPSNDPVHHAAHMCRKRGRIVLVGVVGLELSRADFYEKELSFQVSCSYGPGRYDPNYEEKGHDYPLGFVRWTEQRNFEAVLDMMADGRLDVTPLISHRFPLEQAEEAYRVLHEERPLGIVLGYSDVSSSGTERTVTVHPPTLGGTRVEGPRLGFIGSGNYATAVLIPAFAQTNARLQRVASAAGLSSVHAAKRHGILEATTDTQAMFGADDLDALVITTRHNSHARLVRDALENRKHVFVEKPLAINTDELSDLKQAYGAIPASERPALMVGFNRRYAPHIQALKAALAKTTAPATFIMTVNAGAIPTDHWTQDPSIGGGRLIGEGCHFVDLLRYLAGAAISAWSVNALDSHGPRDTWQLQLSFANGGVGAILYLSNGNKRFPKERLEVFCAGGIARVDNFRKLESIGWPGLRSSSSLRQDKGQKNCAKAFVGALESGDYAQLIPADELFEVAELCIAAAAELGVR